MADMEVGGIAGASTALRQQQVQQNVQTKMLKVGMDTQTQLAEQLLETIPQTPNINPSYLGQKIDIKF